MDCPSCGSSAVLYDNLRGERICTSCGLVIVERLLELGPEWRMKPGEETGRADVTAGVDITQHDLGLGSKFTVPENVSPSLRAKLRRMQLWQRRSRASTWSERSLREALIELDKLCEDLALPKAVKAEISQLYRKAKVAKLTFGHSTLLVLAALVFITCRLRRIPRTEKEVLHALKARAPSQERAAPRSFRKLTRLFTEEMKLRMPRPTPKDYLGKFASQLELPQDTIVRAQAICNTLPERTKRAKPPTLLSAAVLYIASEETGADLTMRKLAATLGIGISSLSQTARLVRELAGRAG